MASRRTPKAGAKDRSRKAPAGRSAAGGDRAALELGELDEARLRRDVLVPLFEAMGYRDVTERHGVRELGKDIVMWEPDILLTRVNIAVVAKRGAISGRADGGPSTATTTANQIRQAYGAQYPDPRTGQPQAISRVLVVASGSISEQAQVAIAASLEPYHRVAMQYIDGGQLARHVQRYLGGTAALAKAAALRAALQELESPFDVKVLVGEDTTSFMIGPKAGSSTPIEGHLVLDTEGSPQGEETRALLDTHIRTGAPVTLTGAQVVVPRLDELMEKLGLKRPTSGRVSLSARRGREITLLFRFRKDGQERILGPVRCQATQVGVEELTLESIGRVRGWALRCVINLPARSLIFNLNCEYEGLSATAFYEALLLTSLLSRGPELTLEEHERGLILGKSVMDEGLLEAPNAGWMMLVRAVAYIEQSKGLVLSIPLRPIEVTEAAVVLETEKLLRGEVVEGSWNTASWKASGVTRQGLEEFAKGDVNVLMVRQTMRLDLFGQQIPLGIRETTLYQPTITRTALRNARAALKAGQTHIPLEIRPRKSPGRVTAVLRDDPTEDPDDAA